MRRVRYANIKLSAFVLMVLLGTIVWLIKFVMENLWVLWVPIIFVISTIALCVILGPTSPTSATSSAVDVEQLSHGLPKFIPGTRTKVLSFAKKPTALFEKPRSTLTEADLYLLKELRERYGAQPFRRGNLDAGRLNRLLGREINYAEKPDPTSLLVMLKLSGERPYEE